MTNAKPERPWTDPSSALVDRVEALAEMTLEEKLAQLGSYWDDKRGSDEVIAGVELEAGASARVGFRLAADRFSFTSRTLERIVEPGEIVLTAGLSSRDAAASDTFRFTGATRVVADGSRILETGVHIVR